MASPKFDRDRAARIVAEAVVAGDASTCAKHKLSLRTLQNYRKRLESDPQLAQAVAEKNKIAERDWAESLPGAISQCIEFVRTRVPKMRTTPDAMHAVAGAMKLLTDVALQRKLLDVRLARAAGQAGEANRSGVGAGGNVVSLRPAQAATASGLHSESESKVSTP